MENYNEITLPKERLIDELREIRTKSLEGISAEEFTKNSNHQVYAGFAEYFATKLESFEFEQVSSEEYTSFFVDTIKEAMRNIGRRGKLNTNQILHAHNYFDSLVETIVYRILKDKENSFTSEAKTIFSKSDFYDLYEKIKAESH